ncbi:mechanosensitive ion channel domain-containing protein [Desulfothermus sp.]
MEQLNYFIDMFDQLLVHKNDIILFSITISIILFLRILVGLLKKRFDWPSLFTKILNYSIILIFVEFLKEKIQGIWFLKILFVLETVLIFLIVKSLIIDLYINEYLLLKKKKKISYIIIDIIKFAIILLFIMVFLRNVFNVDLVTILTPSAIMTAIIGLSMKDTIGNLISGIVIQIEKPFDLGDWIQVGDLIGKVEEINWRYTKIKTILNMYVIIPNNTISSENIINYSKPSEELEVQIDIGVSYEVPPIKVKRAIYDILNKNRFVDQHIEKKVLLMGYGSSSINYKIIFGVRNYYEKRLAIDEIYSSIWYQFKNFDIEIPFPIRTVIMKEQEPRQVDSRIFSVLKSNELLQNARKEVFEFLAMYGNLLKFHIGDKVINEGDVGDTMYIIISGEFEVRRQGKTVAKLKKGDFFGEVALISDQKRNATVVCTQDGDVLEIDRMLFKLVLEKDHILRNEVYKKFKERVVREVKKQKNSSREEKISLFENLKKLCGFYN